MPRQLKHSEIPKLRKKILREQKGVCAICKKPPKRACLDHEHKKRLKGSGLIRGVLCSSCNVFLAKMENNCVRYAIGLDQLPKILKNTRKYIKAKHRRYIHPSEKPKAQKLKKSSYNKLKKIYTKKLPEYPKSGILTKPLKKAFEQCKLKPEFYAK